MLLAQLVLGYDDLEPMTRAACAGDIIEIERLLIATKSFRISDFQRHIVFSVYDKN